MSELGFLPAIELAAMIRRRDIGCVELLDYFVTRHTKYHSAINAIIWTDLERARERAEEADRQVANTLAELIIGGSLASVEITGGKPTDQPVTEGSTSNKAQLQRCARS